MCQASCKSDVIDILHYMYSCIVRRAQAQSSLTFVPHHCRVQTLPHRYNYTLVRFIHLTCVECIHSQACACDAYVRSLRFTLFTWSIHRLLVSPSFCLRSARHSDVYIFANSSARSPFVVAAAAAFTTGFYNLNTAQIMNAILCQAFQITIIFHSSSLFRMLDS